MTELPSTRWLTSTWLWYLEREPGGTVLDASTTRGHLAAALMPHFSKVHILRGDRSALDEARTCAERMGGRPCPATLGSISTVPWPDHSFDCIAVHDTLADRDLKIPDTVETLSRIRLLLKPGGWFVGASPTPAYLRRRRTGRRGISASVFSRMLAEAGFGEVRRLLVTPSLDGPQAMIPDTSRAVMAFEAFDSIGGDTKWTRRAVARLGLHAPLYPGYFVLARA